MKAIRNALSILGEHRRPYIVLNVIYYGLVVAGMVYVFFNPSLQQLLIDAAGQTFGEGGSLAVVGEAYGGGKVLLSIALTFAVNLLVGSLASITLPSLLVPFSGLLMGAYRAVLWGLLLSPAEPALARAMLPHSLTLILEGQAYVVAMLAGYLHGRAFLWPRSVDAEKAWQGYWIGMKRTASLYLLIAVLLAVAAIYEALEVVLLMPRLAGA
jgi:hypothetical protein